jgi:cadmium resistance protein CadD (predicted permease)
MALPEPLTTLTLGVTMFVSTNIDDIFLLAAFFADPRLAVRHIVAGQFLGIALLVAVSAAAALVALVIPERWLALLGVVPLAVGVRLLWQLRGPADDANEEAPARAAGRSQVMAVAAVTVANGGDNLSIYVPVFANEVAAVPGYAAIFAVLTAVWCVAGYALVNAPWAGAPIRKYGQVLLPAVLIGLGLWILRGAAPLLR